MKLKLRYFAVFREARGRSTEEIDSTAQTPLDLYCELALPLPPAIVRAAVNGAFVDMGAELRDGDEVVFIPPVAGG